MDIVSSFTLKNPDLPRSRFARFHSPTAETSSLSTLRAERSSGSRYAGDCPIRIAMLRHLPLGRFRPAACGSLRLCLPIETSQIPKGENCFFG